MRPAFQISLSNRWLEWSWILFFVSLPAGRPFTTYTLLLVLLTSLLSLKKNFINDLKQEVNRFWPVFLYYFFHLAGLLYSDDLQFAFKDLSIKLPLLLIPLLAIPARFTESFTQNAAWGFVFSCLATNLFMLICAFANYRNGNADAFFYDTYSSFIHPAYMSLMNAIAVSVLLFSNLKIFIPYKWILIVSSALLTVSSVLMASKSGILSLLAVYLIYVYKTFSVKNKPVTIMIMSAIICASAFLIWVSPAQDRIKQSLQVILQPGSAINQQEGTAGRLLAWKTAWHISKDYFPLGTGTGDIKKVTLNHYEKTGYHWPLYYKLNAHNQFLQSLAAIGIGGLLSLVLMIFIPLMRSKKDIELPMVFILLVFFNLLFECMFEVQNGVMLIAACYALWIVRPAPSLKNV